MADETNHIVVSYDIANPRRLYLIAKIMKNYGFRVLKSVFECNLNKAQYLEMKYQAEKILDPVEDSVRFYFLCGKCIKNCEFLGKGDSFIEEVDSVII